MMADRCWCKLTVIRENIFQVVSLSLRVSFIKFALEMSVRVLKRSNFSLSLFFFVCLKIDPGVQRLCLSNSVYLDSDIQSVVCLGIYFLSY